MLKNEIFNAESILDWNCPTRPAAVSVSNDKHNHENKTLAVGLQYYIIQYDTTLHRLRTK